jgi:pimeloyl-ACP methyl ester carboxylesterase
MVDAVEVIDKGAGPPVVLVHGDVFGAEMTWAAQEPLAADFHLRMVNRRGFGNSSDTDGEDFEIDAGDVAPLLDGGAHLVGHSYGGVVALMTAARRPGDVRSLVVFEPPAFGLTADDPRTAVSQIWWSGPASIR